MMGEWKLIYSNKHIGYEFEKGFNYVKVYRLPQKFGWKVVRGNPMNEVSDYFKTEKDAMRFARKFMRGN